MIAKRNNSIISSAIKISFLCLMCFLSLSILNAQTNQSENAPLDFPEGPVTCEGWLTRIAEASREWEKNRDATLIIIARLGNGESRRVNLKRIKTLKEYILNPKYEIKAIFAEGDRTNDLGLVEFYVDGKLFNAVAVRQKQDIPLRFCN